MFYHGIQGNKLLLGGKHFISLSLSLSLCLSSAFFNAVSNSYNPSDLW